MKNIKNAWNRAYRRWDPHRCSAPTIKGSRCTNPGQKLEGDGRWYCWQHDSFGDALEKGLVPTPPWIEE